MPPIKRRQVSADVLTMAVELVNSGLSIRNVAQPCGLSNETLGRYVRKQKGQSTLVRMAPNYGHNKIFNDKQENELSEYLIQCAKQFYGLPKPELFKLAYETAVINNIEVPKNWKDRKSAGIKWYRGFRSRHPKICLRTPEGCSLARATSFNKHNVKLFFDNLVNVCSRYTAFADGSRIYNLDETATTTVHSAPKVFALKGARRKVVESQGPVCPCSNHVELLGSCE